MVIEHGPHRTESIDDWAEDEDDPYCYGCDDWAEVDDHDNCSVCGLSIKTIDPYVSPITAKVYSSSAPKVSSHGDMWGRGSHTGYTWEVEEVGGMEAQAPLTLLSGVVAGQQETQTEKHVC